MNQTVDALLDEIRSDLRTVPEVKRVYDDMPDSINDWPAIVVGALSWHCWIASHGHSDGTAPLHCEYDIRIEIHIPLKNLDDDTAKMTRLADAVTVRLYSGFVADRYTGTMLTTAAPRTGGNSTPTLTANVGPSRWDSQETLAAMIDFRAVLEKEATA